MLGRLLNKSFFRAQEEAEEKEERGWSSLPSSAFSSFSSTKTSTGILVNEQKAMSCATVYACVGILSDTLGTLPLITYRRLSPRGKERDLVNPLYRIFHDTPNPEITSVAFRSALWAHVFLWGNAYAEIERNNRGAVVALWPLNPSRTRPFRTLGDNQLFYELRLMGEKKVFLRGDQVFHIAGLGFDGLYGYSPIALLRESIGLALATDSFGASFFSNGLNPGGVLEHPAKVTEKMEKNLKKSFREEHEGLSNAHRIMVLGEGMKWHQIGIPPEDSQFLETRVFQKREIAGVYRVPPHMIGDLERSTFSNIEHQQIQFGESLVPWCTRWEQQTNRCFFQNAPESFVEHLLIGMRRGDQAARSAYYRERFMIGTLSQNDIREYENENPLPFGGDTYYVPLNMVDSNVASTSSQTNFSSQSGSFDASKESQILKFGEIHVCLLQEVFSRMFRVAEKTKGKVGFQEKFAPVLLLAVSPAMENLGRLICVCVFNQTYGAYWQEAVLRAGVLSQKDFFDSLFSSEEVSNNEAPPEARCASLAVEHVLREIEPLCVASLGEVSHENS